MRKTKEEVAESRRRILNAASGLYREKGFDGVGVADIMEAAGMTHGGFYRHFPSKEALISEAMGATFADRTALLTPAEGATEIERLRDYVRMYLSEGHIEIPSGGCPVAAVGSEAAHVGGVVSTAFNDGIEQLVVRMASALGGKDEDRMQALRLLSTMVGAVVVARAAGTGSKLRADVLQAVRNDDEVAPLVDADRQS